MSRRPVEMSFPAFPCMDDELPFFLVRWNFHTCVQVEIDSIPHRIKYPLCPGLSSYMAAAAAPSYLLSVPHPFTRVRLSVHVPHSSWAVDVVYKELDHISSFLHTAGATILFCFASLCFVLFETGSHVSWAGFKVNCGLWSFCGLELLILLLSPPKYWDDRYTCHGITDTWYHAWPKITCATMPILRLEMCATVPNPGLNAWAAIPSRSIVGGWT